MKEFLDLEQGNHSVFDYMRQFNILTQYGSYHINMDEKKANLYRAGLTIHLQECLVQFASLSYNDLVSAAIDQERMMKVVAEADDKKRKRKRKRMMSGSAGSGNFNGAPPKYRMVYTPHGGQQQNWGNHPQFQPRQFQQQQPQQQQ
jgi:4-diphosphocytidyl-2C-methyl-D-erythritol kinase